MKVYGDTTDQTLFVYVCDKEELGSAENVYSSLCSLTERRDFGVLVYGVNSWFEDLSPWEAPPVFGKQAFGSGAEKTLSEIIGVLEPYIFEGKTIYICGYSLAGLFTLWASTQSPVFSGVCAASPSVWFPSWLSFVEKNPVKASKVYLSLGDKEEKSKDPVMATVGQCMKKQYEKLLKEGKNCYFELNRGNHFTDADLRVAKGMAWLLNTEPQR